MLLLKNTTTALFCTQLQKFSSPNIQLCFTCILNRAVVDHFSEHTAPSEYNCCFMLNTAEVGYFTKHDSSCRMTPNQKSTILQQLNSLHTFRALFCIYCSCNRTLHTAHIAGKLYPVESWSRILLLCYCLIIAVLLPY